MSILSTAGTIVSRKTLESANTVHKSSKAACHVHDQVRLRLESWSHRAQRCTHICSTRQGLFGVQDSLDEDLGHLLLVNPSVLVPEQLLVCILLLRCDL
jgi:hypothetical protein